MSQDLAGLLNQVENHGTGGILLGLSRVKQLLSALSNPQEGLQVIHIAGTNGKGSVAAVLEAILRQAGFRVGLYSSPHLVHFNERIQINREPISDPQLIAILRRVLAVCREESIPATFFEITTAAAFCHFSQQGLKKGGESPGLVILETGLGGRLDATNVVTPLLSLITAIAVDHTDFLGSDIRQIAKEKAGILKPGGMAAAAPNNHQAQEVIIEQADAVQSELLLMGRDFFHQPERTNPHNWCFNLKTADQPNGTLSLPPPGLLGAHQRDNCALAVAGTQLLIKQGWQISPQAIAQGVAQATWPGRLEWFFDNSNPLLLDGAHNLHAARCLAHYLEGLSQEEHPSTLIFSALKNKESQGIAQILAPLVEQVWTVKVGGSRGLEADYLASHFREENQRSTPCPSVASALELARSHTPKGKRILIAGSLFLVGEVRSLLL
jgi:dihydrofolate synthase / folylpolyglutamate synthase